MSDSMRAAVMTAPDQLSIQTVEKPKLEKGEVLLKVHAVSICGSDPKVFNGSYLPMWPGYLPFIAGHECAGEIVEIGEGVTDFQIGDRVACEAHCGCGQCINCEAGDYNLCLNYNKPGTGHHHYGFTTQGGYAEYAAYNTKSICKLPDNVSYEEASLCDTCGTAYHAVRLAGIVKDGWTLVIGPGPMGNFAMQIAKALGSKTIMVGRGLRLEIAKKMGADVTINYEECDDIVAKVKEITDGLGAHRAFECAGTDAALKQCIYSLRKNGHAAFVAMPAVDEHMIPTKTLVMNQITLHGSRANPHASFDVLKMMSEGKIDAKGMVTHKFPLDDIVKAVDIFYHRKDGAMKVIVEPNK